ncbi:lectin BRA-2-like [Haliotis cracherodii]|uniref:lectin BRA-2-like n=1 Tax=Haliotis cracherodii TaxID=6455 RepID=UPI0039E794D4
MSFHGCLQTVYIAFVLTVVVGLLRSVEGHSCDVTIDGCEYELKISAKSKTCTNINPFVSYYRQKRSVSETAETDQQVNPITREDLKQLSKKVTRMLDKLSTRVLRWWRKLDQKVDELSVKSNGRMRSQSVHLSNRCPDGFIGIENWPSCYLLSHFNTSWYEAKDYCGAFESDLVAMGTVREHYILSFVIKNNPAISEAEGWWTSGSFLGSTRQWMWTSQFFTKPFTFIKWADGEPNEDGSQCMLLSRDENHQWNDAICTEHFNFICEVQGLPL